MFNIKTYNTLISNKYSNRFSRLGFSLCYMLCKFDYGSWYCWYFFFLVMTGLKGMICLPQLVQANANFVIPTCIDGLTIVFIFGVISRTL